MTFESSVTPERRAEIVDMCRAHGYAEVSRLTGHPQATLRGWVFRANRRPPAPAKVLAAAAASTDEPPTLADLIEQTHRAYLWALSQGRAAEAKSYASALEVLNRLAASSKAPAAPTAQGGVAALRQIGAGMERKDDKG